VVRGFPDAYSGAAADPEKEFVRLDEELLLADLAVHDMPAFTAIAEKAKAALPAAASQSALPEVYRYTS
jgi:hypothetical protein